MTGVKIFVISTNIGIYLIPILRIHKIRQSKVILEMKVSVEQTNIVYYCTKIPAHRQPNIALVYPVVYRLETDISNSADHLQVSIPTGHNSIRPSLKCICCVRLFLRLFDQADGKTDTFKIPSSPSWLLGITIIIQIIGPVSCSTY